MYFRSFSIIYRENRVRGRMPPLSASAGNGGSAFSLLWAPPTLKKRFTCQGQRRGKETPQTALMAIKTDWSCVSPLLTSHKTSGHSQASTLAMGLHTSHRTSHQPWDSTPALGRHTSHLPALTVSSLSEHGCPGRTWQGSCTDGPSVASGQGLQAGCMGVGCSHDNCGAGQETGQSSGVGAWGWGPGLRRALRFAE